MSIEEDTRPHFTIVCDVCGDTAGTEDYGGAVLYESREEAVRAVTEDWEWRLTGGTVTCAGCLEDGAPVPSEEVA